MKYVLYLLIIAIFTLPALAQNTVYQAGHESLQHWLLPKLINPDEQQLKLIELGKKLFFDKRLSSSGEVSCSSCHNPENGWEDGLVKAQLIDGNSSRLHSPTLVNLAFSKSFTWNGHINTLQDEAYHAFSAKGFMNLKPKLSFEGVIELLNEIPYYQTTFKQLFPDKKISRKTISTAIAAFEKTIISNNSSFDQWVKGDSKAMTQQQIEGFKLFNEKAKCSACHQAPNFTDNGFHNIGLKSYAEKNHLIGRKKVVPLNMLDGAFKTPTLRDIALRAPYFHDGSGHDLEAVIKHYMGKDLVDTNLSPSFNTNLALNQNEIVKVIKFMESLTSKNKFKYPKLPESPK